MANNAFGLVRKCFHDCTFHVRITSNGAPFKRVKASLSKKLKSKFEVTAGTIVHLDTSDMTSGEGYCDILDVVDDHKELKRLRKDGLIPSEEVCLASQKREKHVSKPKHRMGRVEDDDEVKLRNDCPPPVAKYFSSDEDEVECVQKEEDLNNQGHQNKVDNKDDKGDEEGGRVVKHRDNDKGSLFQVVNHNRSPQVRPKVSPDLKPNTHERKDARLDNL